MKIEGDYYSRKGRRGREGIQNVRMWPYYAPNPLSGGAAKGAQGGRRLW